MELSLPISGHPSPSEPKKMSSSRRPLNSRIPSFVCCLSWGRDIYFTPRRKSARRGLLLLRWGIMISMSSRREKRWHKSASFQPASCFCLGKILPSKSDLLWYIKYLNQKKREGTTSWYARKPEMTTKIFLFLLRHDKKKIMAWHKQQQL